jgi:hypothetical protein
MHSLCNVFRMVARATHVQCTPAAGSAAHWLVGRRCVPFAAILYGMLPMLFKGKLALCCSGSQNGSGSGAIAVLLRVNACCAAWMLGFWLAFRATAAFLTTIVVTVEASVGFMRCDLASLPDMWDHATESAMVKLKV